jgi:GNAT superfamily N-acetyltransferase
VTQRFFTHEYGEHAKLRDDTRVLLRLICPEDKELLRREFERWSSDSRYSRFHAPKQRLSDEELRYLTECDQETHFAIGAISDDPRGDADGDGKPDIVPVGLGVARFIRLPDRPGEPVTAEAAISVADHAQGKGLGKLLFLRLVAAATERGIEHFRCFVLGTNSSMQDLIEGITPEHTTEIDAGVMSIDFALPPVAPQAAPAEAPEGGLYRLFRAVAEGAVRMARALVD